MSPRKVARCPKCRGTILILTEVHEESGETDPGEHVVEDGMIFPASAFWFSAGDPTAVFLECTDCGHQWRTLRVVGPVGDGA